VDATRRTFLAGERTLLAWVRTGLASTAVALGVGRVVPEVTDSGTTWPYVIVGAGYALLGAACVLYGFLRQRALEAAFAQDGFVPPSRRAIAAFGVAGTALALATTLLILAAP